MASAGGESLIERVVDKLLGRIHPYVLNAFGYAALFVASVWGVNILLDELSKLDTRADSTSLSASSLPDLALALASVALIALLFGVALRITNWGLYRSEIREIKTDIAAIKERLNVIDPPQESEAEDG